MQWLLDLPIAHRGLHNTTDLPENSLAAFEAAIEKGFPIEFDVRLINDGNLMVFHDLSLMRMTNQSGIIAKKSLSEIRDIRLLGTSEKIPKFIEVLELVNGRVPILIEVKNRKNIGRLENKLLHFLLHYKGEYAIESFNPFSVRWFRENAPGILRGQLSGAFGRGAEMQRKALLRGLFFYRMGYPDFLAYDIRYLPSRAVNKFRANGLPVIGYTAKNPVQFQHAQSYCDNIIFDSFLPE